jgi:DNA-binding IclR family transcriptional regulator
MKRNEPPPQANQSLASGIACLQALATAGRPLGSREIARLLGDEPTRTNRLLRTLASLHLAEQTADRKYRPGPAMHVLAAQSLHGSALLTSALPHIRSLRAERGGDVAVALGVLWNLRVTFLVYARPGQPLEEAVGSYGVHAFDDSSVGIVLAASRYAGPAPEPLPERVEPFLAERFEALRPRLEEVRLDGAARLTFPRGITSLGVPVDAPPVAGLAISGRFEPGEIGGLVRALKRAADGIAAGLRHRPPAGDLPPTMALTVSGVPSGGHIVDLYDAAAG